MKTYDWANKVAVQVGRRELPTVCAVLTGYINECKFNYHGPEKNKGYSICAQDTGVLIRLSSKSRGVIAVPVVPADLFYFSLFVLNRLKLNSGDMSGDVTLALLKCSYGQRVNASAGRFQSS